MAEVKKIFNQAEEDERAALIERMLNLTSAMVEALRYGFNEKSAEMICNLLLPFTNSDAVSICDKDSVLAYIGFMQEHYPKGQEITSRATAAVLNDGIARCMLTEEGIGFPEANHQINAAIIEPLVIAGNTVGVLKFYYKSPDQVTKSQRMIAKGFSKLISTQLAAEEVELQRDLNRQMEVKVLQSQINPHFLFNTINGIMSLTRTNPDNAREMLRDLAGYYRATLEQDESDVTLRDELENARRYVALQQMRWGEDRLAYKITAEEDLLDTFHLPQFVLQPIVENSVIHAMRTSGLLTITIDVTSDDKMVFIKISDDGNGMSQEKAQSLFKESAKEEGGQGLGLAMKNVHSRIKRHFGRRSHIQVESKRWVGTTTTFYLPKINS